jgi:hypothetical protein
MANRNGQGKTNTLLPITDSASTPRVSRDAKAFWFSLSLTEKRNRSEQASRVADRIVHFRQYLNDSDQAIARQARHEVQRHTDELRTLGFYLPATEERK